MTQRSIRTCGEIQRFDNCAHIILWKKSAETCVFAAKAQCFSPLKTKKSFCLLFFDMIYQRLGDVWTQCISCVIDAKSKTFFSFHFPFQTKLNAMGNYLARSWTPTLKCMQCKENTLELSDLSVKIKATTVLFRSVRSLFGPTRELSPWGNFFDSGLNQSIKPRLPL